MLVSAVALYVVLATSVFVSLISGSLSSNGLVGGNAECQKFGLSQECIIRGEVGLSQLARAVGDSYAGAGLQLWVEHGSSLTISQSMIISRKLAAVSSRSKDMLDFGGLGSGQIMLGMHSVLTLQSLLVTSMGFKYATKSDEDGSMQLVPVALAMQPHSRLALESVTISGACETVAALAADACMQGADISKFEVGISWVYIKSGTYDGGGDNTTVSVRSVNMTCNSTVAVSPCVIQQVSTGAELIGLLQGLQGINFGGTAYITAAGDLSLVDDAVAAGGASSKPLVTVQGYKLVLRGPKNSSRMPIIDMGGVAGIIQLSATGPSSNASSAGQALAARLAAARASSDSSTAAVGSGGSVVQPDSGTAAAVLRLEGVVLHNLPPGPPSGYPYTLMTAMLWSIDLPRWFGSTNTSSDSPAQARLQLELLNCTLVLPYEETLLFAGFFSVNYGATGGGAPPQAQPPSVYQAVATNANVSRWRWVASGPPVLANMTMGEAQGLRAAWSWQNVTLHSASYPLNGRFLKAVGSSGASDLAHVLAFRHASIYGDELQMIGSIQVVKSTSSNNSLPAKLDASYFGSEHVAGSDASGVGYRLMLADNTQVDVPSIINRGSLLALREATRLLITGDPVDPTRIVLDLQTVASAISMTSASGWEFYPFVQLDSLVLINAGKLPASHFDAMPVQSPLPGNLNSGDRSVLCNVTSTLWFFNLSQTSVIFYHADSPLILQNVTLVLNPLEVQVIVDLAGIGTTLVNIAPELEELLKDVVGQSSKPELRMRNGVATFFFKILKHFQYTGYDITLISTSYYNFDRIRPLANILNGPNIGFTQWGQVTYKDYPRPPAPGTQPASPLVPSPAEGSKSIYSNGGAPAPKAAVVAGVAAGAAGACVLVLLASVAFVINRNKRHYRGQELETFSTTTAHHPNNNHHRTVDPQAPCGGVRNTDGINVSQQCGSSSVGADSSDLQRFIRVELVSQGAYAQRQMELNMQHVRAEVHGAGQQSEQPTTAAAIPSNEATQRNTESHNNNNHPAEKRVLLDDMRDALALGSTCGDDLAGLEIEGLLAKGGNGVVYRGTWRGLPVAVKRLVFQQSGQQASTKLQFLMMQEIAINASVRHDNVVSTYGYGIKPLRPESLLKLRTALGASTRTPDIFPNGSIQDWQLLLVQELCSEGNLNQAVAQNRFFDPAAGAPILLPMLHICEDIFKGLDYLHSKRLVHADVKLENIFLVPKPPGASAQSGESHTSAHINGSPAPDGTSGGSTMMRGECGGQNQGNKDDGSRTVVAKLGDFGLSVMIQAGLSHMSGVRRGTPLYMAPEVMELGHVSQASDIYAAGVVMWELYHGTSAWGRLIQLVRQGALGPRPALHVQHFLDFNAHHALPEFEALVRACWSQDRNLRPTARECLDAIDGMIGDLRNTGNGAPAT